MSQENENSKGGPSQWVHVLGSAEIDAHFALTAQIDAKFATRARAFYESRTDAELTALANQAWLCNEATSFQLARSFAALALAGA